MNPYENQPQNLSTPELPPSHRHFLNKKFITAFVILILLGGTALGGLWWWQEIQAANHAEDLVVVPVSHESGETKLYANAELGFAIQIPKNWSADLSEKSMGIITFVDSTQKNSDTNYELTIRKYSGNRTTTNDPEVYNLFEKKTIGRLTWYRFSPVGEDLDPQFFTNVPDGKHYFEVKWNFLNIDEVEVTKILATFSFADGSGQFCGGIAGLMCPSGYSCKLDGSYPDAGGSCAKDVLSYVQCVGAGHPIVNNQCIADTDMIFNRPDPNTVCAQVIVKASNPKTGHTGTFATPCDVPVGWTDGQHFY